MEFPDPYASLRDRKLVVLGIPFDVETEELKYYLQKFGELEDCIVMKDRLTGQSRGFGYATFVTAEDAKKVTAAHHVLSGRTLDIKVATPKDEMTQSTSRKGVRIFVARIPPHVTEGMFRSYFQKYGVIVDAYMPKDVGSRMHRGIGFVTFENTDSVDKIMTETHELGGSTIAVDRATPKDETAPKFWGGKSHSVQSNKSYPQQWGKDLPDQWAKSIPEEWSKCIPEEWAKAYPEQFNFFMAAAAAAAQMGAFGGMEGFDFSAFGFPNGMGTEKTESAWTAPETGAKDPKELPGGDEQSQPLLGGAQAYSHQNDSVASNAPVASSTACVYDSESAQNNPASGYANSANNNMYYPESGYGGYGSGSQAASIPSTYGSSISQSGVPAAPASYGGDFTYNVMPTPPETYNAGGYYDGAVRNSSSAAQSYGPEYASRTGYSASYGSGPGASYSDSRYSSNNPYAPHGVGYGPRSSYRGAAYGQDEPYNNEARSGYSGLPVPSSGNKVFIGKLPHEATAEHLRTYFSSFGRILDVYIPKDAKKTGHRGFGFVTFFDESVAEQVAMASHEILGQPVAVDRPTPQDSSANMPYATWGSNVQRMGYGGGHHGNLDYYTPGMGHYGGGRQSSSYDAAGASRSHHYDARYRPY